MKKRLSNYTKFVPESKISKIYRKGTKLSKYHMVHISSNYYGGGIAENLRNIVPLLNEIGIDIGWRSVVGTPDFFRVCKRFHNALLGEEINLTKMKKRVFEETNEAFARFTHIDHDMVIIHNHQPLPLISFYSKRQPWICRCHEDFSEPNQEIIDYLKSFLIPFDRHVFQTGDCAFPTFQDICSSIQPGIDPLSTKNESISEQKINKYLNKNGIDPSRPLISQVSQFDKHKDPLGVIEVFKQIKEEMDCQLVLIGAMPRNDPEGQKIQEKVWKEIKKLDDAYLIIDPHDIVINSIQRASDVILQKSLREGFGLAVSEALWKKTPVVGSNVGGITTQINDGENGFLVNPQDYEETAEKILKLLSDENLREKMGEKGKERVKEKFLITREIEDWLELWTDILRETERL